MQCQLSKVHVSKVDGEESFCREVMLFLTSAVFNYIESPNIIETAYGPPREVEVFSSIFAEVFGCKKVYHYGRVPLLTLLTLAFRGSLHKLHFGSCTDANAQAPLAFSHWKIADRSKRP